MLKLHSVLANSARALSGIAQGPKVALLGASGGIGQGIALLLKMNQRIGMLSLYDIVHTPGVGADLSHINTPAKVEAHMGPMELPKALAGAKIVVIAAGSPARPNLPEEDMFKTNAAVVRQLCEAAAQTCPDAFIAIATHPVNSIVPIAAEVLKKSGAYNGDKLFGVSTLGMVRATTFLAEAKDLDVDGLQVPVVGGHWSRTMVPLPSQANVSLKKGEFEALLSRLQEADDTVRKVKQASNASTLSPTLAMSYSGARFVNSLLDALEDKRDLIEYAFIATDQVSGVDYCTTPFVLGKSGITKRLDIGKITDVEEKALRNAIGQLKLDIEKGEKFSKYWGIG